MTGGRLGVGRKGVYKPPHRRTMLGLSAAERSFGIAFAFLAGSIVLTIWLFILLAATALLFVTYRLGERAARSMAHDSADRQRTRRGAQPGDPSDPGKG
jgi:hypothetical protein